MYYELRRQYHCAAYNMLMAVISCTQNKLQFYMGFLFKEDPIKASKGPLLVVARPLLAITGHYCIVVARIIAGVGTR